MIRVVVVEDSAVVRRAVIDLLADLTGFHLAGSAADLPSGLQLAQRELPDLLLLDAALLPLVDAEAREVRSQADGCFLVLVTFRCSRRLRARAQLLGIDRCLEVEHLADELPALASRIPYRKRGSSRPPD